MAQKGAENTIMNSIMLKVLGGVISLFTIIYFGYQVYMMTYDPYPTETALVNNYTDQIELHGIAVKSEQVLDEEATGIVKYTNSNSKKVVSDATVATIYANEQDMLIGDQIEEKQEKLDLLKEIEEKRSTISVNAQGIVSGIKEQQLAFVKAVDTDDYSTMNNIENSMLSLLLRQRMVLDQTISFADNVAALENEITSLQGRISKEGKKVSVASAGYFTNEVDGYENIIKPKDLEDLTDYSVSDLNQILEKNVQGSPTAVGKLIDSTEWFFLAVFDGTNADRLKVDNTVTLQFPNSAGYSVKANISQVFFEEGDEQGVVLLESNNMSDAIVDLRVENPSMVFSSSKGIKISKEAMRIVQTDETSKDGSITRVSTPGVYIAMGQVVRFKKIDVLYEADDYVIGRLHEDENGYLHIYDEVILEGDDLYDGKPIR